MSFQQRFLISFDTATGVKVASHVRHVALHMPSNHGPHNLGGMDFIKWSTPFLRSARVGNVCPDVWSLIWPYKKSKVFKSGLWGTHSFSVKRPMARPPRWSPIQVKICQAICGGSTVLDKSPLVYLVSATKPSRDLQNVNRFWGNGMSSPSQ